jgi:hypothetical protein
LSFEPWEEMKRNLRKGIDLAPDPDQHRHLVRREEETRRYAIPLLFVYDLIFHRKREIEIGTETVTVIEIETATESEAARERKVVIVIEKGLPNEIAKENEVMIERIQEKIQMNQKKKLVARKIQLPRLLH